MGGEILISSAADIYLSLPSTIYHLPLLNKYARENLVVTGNDVLRKRLAQLALT